MDTLMSDKEFREKFNQEYQNLCISEQIASSKGENRGKETKDTRVGPR